MKQWRTNETLCMFSVCVHLAILLSNNIFRFNLHPHLLLYFLRRLSDGCSAGRACLCFWAESMLAWLRSGSMLTSVASGQYWLSKRGHVTGIDCLIKWQLKTITRNYFRLNLCCNLRAAPPPWPPLPQKNWTSFMDDPCWKIESI